MNPAKIVQVYRFNPPFPTMKNHMVLRLFAVLAAMMAATFSFAQESKFDEPPMPSKTVAPNYPSELKREGVVGMVTLSILVDEKGNVQNPIIKKSSRPEFEKPALDAVSKWKFEPAKKDGKPVAVQVVIPMKFMNN